MSAVAVAVAFLLPTAFGYCLWWLLLGRPRGWFGQAAAIGAGYLIGSVGLGAVLTCLDGMATPTLFAAILPWLAGATLLLAGMAWRMAPGEVIQWQRESEASARERWSAAALFLLLMAAFVVIVLQATALPTLTWDAWNAWLAKSKAWYFAGQFLPATSFEAWRDLPSGQSITTTAWIYPEALPRFAVWLASASGDWSEATVHLAWPLAWAALGLACFGYLGLMGCRRLPALATAAAILTLPLITAHASLAGYVDLWLAAMVMLAGLHWLRWHRSRAWREAVMAALCAVALPLLKPEGAIWLACLAGATVLALLPRRWRWGVVLVGPVVWASSLPFGGLRLPLPGLGMAKLGWGSIEIPTRGTMQLSWRPVLDEVAQALFLFPNWSLLWYLAPVVLVLRWRRLLRAPDLSALAWFLGAGYTFLFVLFFLTDAAAWAENFTSVNRVLMQIVPVTVVWLSLLWAAPASPSTTPSTAA